MPLCDACGIRETVCRMRKLLEIIQLRSCEDNELPFSQTNLLIEGYNANDIELFEFYQFLFEQLLNTLDATSAKYWEKTANSILYSFLNTL